MWHSPKTWVTHRVPDSRLANHHEPAAAVSRRAHAIVTEMLDRRIAHETEQRTIATQHAIALRRRLQTIDPAAPADLLDGNAWHAYLEEHR